MKKSIASYQSGPDNIICVGKEKKSVAEYTWRKVYQLCQAFKKSSSS